MRTHLHLCALASAVGACSVATAQFQFRPVAVTGQQAAGLPAGWTYTGFGTTGTINDHGQVVFLGGARQGSNSTDAVWAGAAGSLSLRAKKGEAVPGLPNANIFSFEHYPSINNAGETLYTTIMVGSGVPFNAARTLEYCSASGVRQIVAQHGQLAPDTYPGTAYGLGSSGSDFHGRLMGPDGAYFTSFLDNPNDERFLTGLFIGPPGDVHCYARTDDQAAGLPPGISYINMAGGPVLARDGSHAVFRSTLAGPGVQPSNSVGVFSRHSDGTISLVARPGDPAPGMSGQFGLGVGCYPGPNGTVAVFGDTTTNQRGVWHGTPGSLSLVAASGQAVPQLGPGVTFRTLDTATTTASGAVVFIADMAGPGFVLNQNSSTVWYWSDGSLTQIARMGTDAPGLAPGIRYAGIPTHSIVLSVCDTGAAAFVAPLSGPGVTSANDAALFAFIPGLGTSALLREGDTITVGPGDVRTVSSLALTTDNFNIETFNQTIIGTDGTLVFTAYFTNGSSGLFTVVIPGPGGVALCGVGAVALSRRRRPVAS